MNPNDPAFLEEYLKASSSPSAPSLQAVVHHTDSAPPPPSVPKSPPRPLNPFSKSSVNQKKQSAHLPKFGDWDADGKGERKDQQPLTSIFDSMYATNSFSSSPQAVGLDADSAATQPSSVHGSPQHPLNSTSRVSMNQKNQLPQVPKFGDWDADGKNAGEQTFTLIFDNKHDDKRARGLTPNDPEFYADSSLNLSSSSSASSQAAIHGVSQLSPSPLRHEIPRPPVQPTSKELRSNKSVMAPKFGNWDLEHPAEYTVIFDDLKEEKKFGHVSRHPPKTSTSPTTPLRTHKTFSTHRWLCFSRNQAVRD